MKVWLPTIRTGSGADQFSIRLAKVLVSRGIDAEITWFPHWCELAPDLLRFAAPPSGTTLIHANTWNGFAFARRGIPLVLTEHHCVIDPEFLPQATAAQQIYYRTWIRTCIHRSLAAADAVTAVSRYTAEALRRATGVEVDAVIHNWVDTDLFRPSIVPRKPGPFRLLFVGNPTWRKGADILSPLMARLGSAFELTIVAGLRCKKARITGPNIRTVGPLSSEALIEMYQRSDAVLVPSRLEGFSYVALEAMACGKPVIASAASAIPEVITHQATGLLCPPGDTAAFEDMINQLSTSDQDALRLGEAGRRRAVEMFLGNLSVTAYLDVYDRVAETSRSPDYI